MTVPLVKGLNGPLGRTLDTNYLAPLEIDRKDSWLYDLLPESKVNPAQKEAITKHYTKELIQQYNFPEATIPDFKKKN